MKTTKWWTLESVFMVGAGVLMAVVLGGAFMPRSAAQSGSDLIPAPVLQEIRDYESGCNTITDKDIRVRVRTGVSEPRC